MLEGGSRFAVQTGVGIRCNYLGRIGKASADNARYHFQPAQLWMIIVTISKEDTPRLERQLSYSWAPILFDPWLLQIGTVTRKIIIWP